MVDTLTDVRQTEAKYSLQCNGSVKRFMGSGSKRHTFNINGRSHTHTHTHTHTHYIYIYIYIYIYS